MDLLDDFAVRAKRYLDDRDTNSVYPSKSSIDQLQQLYVPLQDESIEAETVLAILDDVGSPATVKSSAGRYFGFVTGGALPASLLAKLLATVWDQNAALFVQSPIASILEEISSQWLLSIFGLPEKSAVGFVTGATMANFSALVSARHSVLQKAGWDAEANGLFNAPEITVITGDEVHVSLLKALNLAGLGRERIVRVPADDQGRMIVEKIPDISGPAIICAQAGNVNTGAFDNIEAICARFQNGNAWIHVDAAFGLWAAATPKLSHLVKGIENADSWATDAHKWLNVPYDCGLVFIKNSQSLVQAMSATASYLPGTDNREPFQFVPEMSRESRGVPVWAALKCLGKKGVADLIERNCFYAKQFANELGQAGYKILNDVVLNQVLVSFGEPSTTLEVIKAVQEAGVCWCGGTVWQGKTAMRISVSSWATSEKDVADSITSIVSVARKIASAV